MSYKAVYVEAGGGFDKVSIGTVSAAEPKTGEITVRLHSSSLNYHDLFVVSGVTGPREKRIPMSDGAGEVIAVGEGVREFKVGDHVVSTFHPMWIDGEPLVNGFRGTPGDGIDGFAREVVTAGANAFTLMPKGYTFAEAATLTTAGLTAWHSLIVDGKLKPGDTVLIQGTGGVSIFALQFAKMAGAKVIATSSKDEKLERMRAMGADELINYQSTPQWGKKVIELTAGRGVDHVIEVGGANTLQQSMIAARIGGHVSLIGVLSGGVSQMSIGFALTKQLRLNGVLVGSRRDQQDMIKAIDLNGMKPVLDKHFDLDDIVAAFKYQQSGQHFGKICLDI